MTTITDVSTTSPDVTTPAGAGRVRLVAGALAAAGATLAGIVLTHPWGDRADTSSDEIFFYDQWLEHRDATWPALMADGFAFAVLGITVALAVCSLVRGRGRIAALVGAVLTTAGGVLFAMGASASAAMAWYVTSDALPEQAGRDLVDHLNANPGHQLGAQMAGFGLMTLGTLVVGVALWRGRAVPRLAIVTYAVLTVGLFLGLQGMAMNTVQALQTLLLASLAIPLWRSASAEPA
jgi:hypothetical protein